MKFDRLVRILLPLLALFAVLAGWEIAVDRLDIAPYVLPRPTAIAAAISDNFTSLAASAWVTLRLSLISFALALVCGVSLAVVFAQNRLLEITFFPYAVILQVTPIVSIAPLIIIWVGLDNVSLALVILSFVAAFFPILSNMIIGLRSTDPGLVDLFRLYGAGRLQILTRLQLPSALPYLLAGMKISGGLAIIGMVVAEFVAGSGGSNGLAWRIIEAGNRLQIARMFAALVFLSLLGIGVYFALRLLEHALLRRWHPSARPNARPSARPNARLGSF